MTKIQRQRANLTKDLIKGIRKRCLDCSAYNPHEIKKCVSTDCGLYPYRNGLNKICEKSPCKNVKTDEIEAIREGCE